MGEAPTPAPHPGRYPRSEQCYERARKVIPGGIHLSGRPLLDPQTSPMYFERASGCRVFESMATSTSTI